MWHWPPPAGRVVAPGDLGYWSLDVLQDLLAQQAFWLSRLQSSPSVWEPTGQRWDLVALLEVQYTAQVDLPIHGGAMHHLPAGLVTVRAPQEVADQRRRRLRADARHKGRGVRATRLALVVWTIFVTNVRLELLSLQEVLVLARTRWQIELLFNLRKSHGRRRVALHQAVAGAL